LFPRPMHDRIAPLPTPCQQVLWHGVNVYDTLWRNITVHFTAERTGDFEVVLYPRQSHLETPDLPDYGSVFTSEVTDTMDTSYSLELFHDPFTTPHTGLPNHLTRVEFDNIEIAPTVYDTCATICFHWREPEMPDPELVLTMDSCAHTNSDWLATYLLHQIDSIDNALRNDWQEQYIAHCALPESINDTFVLSYDLNYYHYTLFYYDLMGRLIKTVPPKGVDKNDSYTRNDRPAHSLFTEYQYNSLNNMVRKETPDGGEAFYHYDRLGRIRFSQDPVQQQQGQYAYTRYDNLGRVVETGLSSDSLHRIHEDRYTNNNGFPFTGTERTYIVYGSLPGTTVYYNEQNDRPQRVRSHQISYTYTDDATHTYYSYDPHGRVEWMAQQVPGLEDANTGLPALNYVGYEYDVITGQIIEVRYNESFNDRFLTRLEYNADQRLIAISTSSDGLIWDRDVKMQYADYGPLARTELGEDHVQGIDYTYTLLGWLKGINHPDPANDPGLDGLGGVSPHAHFAKDQFGMSLGYFDGDFNRTGSAFASTDSTYLPPVASLYNGNISTWASKVNHSAGGQFEQLTGQKFRYDELNRLTKNRFHYHEATGWNNNANQHYNSDYAFDANGNLTKVSRRAFATEMDSLVYHYQTGTNRLSHIDDHWTTTSITSDLEDQDPDNYTYNANGELIQDQDENITSIAWNAQGKVKTVTKTNRTINFLYNASGNRVRKVVQQGGQSDTLYYVRDAAGRTLARYEQQNGTYFLKENPIGIHKRFGTRKLNEATQPGENLPDTNTVITARVLNQKQYELTDHLGNVRVLVSDDRKVLGPVGGKSKDQQAINLGYWHYYPFGMQAPGRTNEGSGYTYGFNGMERDDEVKGNGNSYTSHFRRYDPRVARWLSVDPLDAKFPGISPYSAMANNPISFTDPDGDAPQQGNPGQLLEFAIIQRGDVEYHVATFKATEGTWVSSSARFIGLDQEYSMGDGFGAYVLQDARFFREDGSQMDYPDNLDEGEIFRIVVARASINPEVEPSKNISFSKASKIAQRGWVYSFGASVSGTYIFGYEKTPVSHEIGYLEGEGLLLRTTFARGAGTGTPDFGLSFGRSFQRLYGVEGAKRSDFSGLALGMEGQIGGGSGVGMSIGAGYSEGAEVTSPTGQVWTPLTKQVSVDVDFFTLAPASVQLYGTASYTIDWIEQANNLYLWFNPTSSNENEAPEGELGN
ncbi:MAG: RHS repeat domain-containing protein, partial [Salibacteraceae bacterium]